jgi:hypothetical protein
MWGKIAEFASFEFTGDGNKKSTGFSGRDLIALLATLGIDLGLFALTIINPPISTPNRNVLAQSEIARTRKAIGTAISTADKNDTTVSLWPGFADTSSII